MAIAWSMISSKVMADPPPLLEACRGRSRDGRAFWPLYSADGRQRKARSTAAPRRRGIRPRGVAPPSPPAECPAIARAALVCCGTVKLWLYSQRIVQKEGKDGCAWTYAEYTTVASPRT